MFRKLTLVSAVSLALLPGAVGALGLGGMGTESALNEPFSGQIELSDIQPDELATVKVLLASEAEFSKVGAPRPAFLDQLSFNTGFSAQGQPIIRVTSNEPVREPYLEFLIEVTWPNGRLIQEYTVLLDPPVTLDRAPPRVAQPEIAAPEPLPVARSEPPIPPPPQAKQSPPTAGASAFPLRYGPVERGAGLWRIARKMSKSSGASVAQTAMALYRNNQHAFIRGDINKLKVGKLLEIPTAAELSALDTAAAEREFQSALQGKTVTSTPLTDITASPKPADRLQIAGKAESAPAQGMPSEAPAAELATEAAVETSAAGDEASPGGTAPGLGAIEQDLLLVQEASESTRQETTELRNRVLELETQLADIQRLLKLSNERFAQLQSAGLDRPEGMAGADVADPPPAAAEDAAAVVGDGEIAEIAAAPESGETGAAAPPRPDAETAANRSSQEPAQEPAAPGFLESIPQGMWAVALAVPTLLLILGWMLLRRRKSLEESLRPSEFTLDTQDPSSGFGEASSAAAEASESSAASASIPSPYSGFGNLEDETEEADIISEADVYIAYGRYREAESLLEEEIAQSPDRVDVKYKLAEAYYGARNLQGMETLMADLQRDGGDQANPEQWQRLNTMLRDLMGPDTDGPPRSEVVEEIPAAAGDRERGQTLGPRLSSPIPPGIASAPVLSAHDIGIETDLLTAVPQSSDSQDRLSRELELDVEDLDVITGSLEPEAGDETLEISGAASDLELQLVDLESLQDMDIATFANRASNADPVSAQSPGPPTANVKVDSLDIAPVGKDSLASDVLSSQWQMDSGMWDEVATKIDLARAYMEMEDPEAARVILEEVAQEGNESQRAEAKEMIAQLG